MTVDDVMFHAMDIFDGRSQVQRWLDRPNRVRADATPRALLSTPEGCHRVLTILGRIDHGVYS